MSDPSKCKIFMSFLSVKMKNPSLCGNNAQSILGLKSDPDI